MDAINTTAGHDQAGPLTPARHSAIGAELNRLEEAVIYMRNLKALIESAATSVVDEAQMRESFWSAGRTLGQLADDVDAGRERLWDHLERATPPETTTSLPKARAATAETGESPTKAGTDNSAHQEGSSPAIILDRVQGACSVVHDVRTIQEANITALEGILEALETTLDPHAGTEESDIRMVHVARLLVQDIQERNQTIARIMANLEDDTVIPAGLKLDHRTEKAA